MVSSFISKSKVVVTEAVKNVPVAQVVLWRWKVRSLRVGIENLVGVIEHLDDNVHLLLVFGKEEVESYFLSRETGEFVFCSGNGVRVAEG